MRYALALALVLVSSCGTNEQKQEPNLTNCAVKEVSEGIEFTCVDKDGKLSTGVVKHGKTGAQGEKGPAGEAGKGLELLSSVECKGSIEGWIEKSAYEIEFQKHAFETGAIFLSASTKLLRGKEVINQRSASSFYVSSPEELSLNDGQLEMKLVGMEVLVSSNGGVSAKIPCLEK
jgi:hypothetical protein